MNDQQQKNRTEQNEAFKLDDKLTSSDIQKEHKGEFEHGMPEVTEFAENIEETESADKITESHEKTQEQKGIGLKHKAGHKKQLTDEQKKQLLLKSNPKPELMKKELTRHLNGDIKIWNKDLRKYENDPDKAYEMSEAWKKIKQAYQLLTSLATLTYEALKKLWLKVVHGIVI